MISTGDWRTRAAALLVALFTVLAAGTVSASATHGPETRVRAIPTAIADAVGQQSSEAAGHVGCLRPSQPGFVSGSCVATEAGYTASKINITEDGLNHVFDRHLADGSLSAGKSLFNDNVTITRLIADADAVVPGVQGNGNLAYVVDAGRAIGVDRVTGQATSTYTVITKPGGDLVTAFPGTP